MASALSGGAADSFQAKKSTEDFIPPCSIVSSVVRLVIAAASGRDDAVHAQVFHHLSVVVESVGHRECCHKQPRHRVGTHHDFHRPDNILRRQHAGGLVDDGERDFQVLHDFSLVLVGGGTVKIMMSPNTVSRLLEETFAVAHGFDHYGQVV